MSPREVSALPTAALLAERARPCKGAISPDNRRCTRSAKAGGVSPAGRRVHCSSRNLSGTCSSSSGVSSIATGNRNAFVAARRASQIF